MTDNIIYKSCDGEKIRIITSNKCTKMYANGELALEHLHKASSKELNEDLYESIKQASSQLKENRTPSHEAGLSLEEIFEEINAIEVRIIEKGLGDLSPSSPDN